jgi:hypothetical protein
VRRAIAMVPSLILLGFVVGMFPRPWFWYGLGMVVIVWVLLLVAPASPARANPEHVAAIALFAVANTAVGAVVARLLVNLILVLVEARRR